MTDLDKTLTDLKNEIDNLRIKYPTEEGSAYNTAINDVIEIIHAKLTDCNLNTPSDVKP